MPWLHSESDYMVCPKCGRISHNRNDVQQRYCGACRGFHDDLLRESTKRRIATEPQAVIETFRRIARPPMRKFMPAESCIAAARITIEVMHMYGIEAKPLPASFVFQVPARKYGRVCGIPKDQQAEWKAKSKSWIYIGNGGWDGHLVVFAANRWLIDPSLDQADAPQFGVHVPSEIYVFDTLGHEWNPNENFEMQIDLVLNNGDQATLNYRSLKDEGYRKTEAWQDEGLPLLAHAIAIDMERAI